MPSKRMFPIPVITSYSIHYTKLYDNLFASNLGQEVWPDGESEGNEAVSDGFHDDLGFVFVGQK